MPFITQGKTNWKFLLIVIVLAIIVGEGALWLSKKEISIQVGFPKTQKEISEQKVLELENQILESKFGSKISEFTIIKKIPTPSLDSCPGIKDYTQNEVWFSEGFPDIKGFSDYAIEGFVGINGEFVCLYANRRGPGSGTPPLIPMDSFYNQVITAGWKTYRNEEYGFEIKYPEKLNMEFISLHPKSVPPKVIVSSNISQLVCEEFEEKSTVEFPTASQKKITVEGETYCGFSGAEGTAGTTYVTYRHSTIKNGKQITLEFTSLYTDCGNYYGVDNKMEKCGQEKDTFDPDILAHQMLSTFKFIEEFCGISTYGSCDSNLDCVKDGCSSQVCRSKNEESIVTTCEYKDCYNAQSYGLGCKCVDKKCQWAK